MSQSSKKNVATNTSGLSKKARRILEVLKLFDYPLNAKTIALYAKINYSTTRSCLRRLNKLGHVLCHSRGKYVANPKCGVGEEPPKVHNLRLKRDGLKGVRSGRVREKVGLVDFDVSFGSKRGKIYGIIGCDVGLGYNETAFAVCHFKDLVYRETGLLLKDDEIEVDSCEFCYDYESVKLEGLQCITVSGFFGTLERIYNRKEGVRSEVKVKPDSVSSILSLLKGGFPIYNIAQNQFVTNQKLSELTDAIKGANRIQLEIWNGLQRYIDADSKSISEKNWKKG